jgi:hypothetical protein
VSDVLVLGRPPGRPRKISSPEEFDAKVDAYVQACRAEQEPVTWTGMALALGFTSRQAIDEYGRYPGFSDSVKRAKTLVERAYEERLHGPAAAGAIFALKNMGWSDARQLEFRGALANIDVSKLPDEVLARIAAGEHPLSVLASAAEGVVARLMLPASRSAAGGQGGDVCMSAQDAE